MNFILDTEKRKEEISSPGYRFRKFHYSRILKADKQIPMLMLIQSLRFDGRNYGAEITDLIESYMLQQSLN